MERVCVRGYQCTVPGRAVFNEHRGKGKRSFDNAPGLEPWLKGIRTSHAIQRVRIDCPHFVASLSEKTLTNDISREHFSAVSCHTCNIPARIAGYSAPDYRLASSARLSRPTTNKKTDNVSQNSPRSKHEGLQPTDEFLQEDQG